MLDVLLPVIQIAAIAACALLWIWRLLLRKLVALEPARAVPWGLLHVALAFVGVGVFSMIGMQIVQYQYDVDLAEKPLAEFSTDVISGVLIAECLAKLVLWAALILGLRLAFGATGRDLGWDGRRLVDDLRLGVLWFFMLVPPVLALHALLQVWFVSEHPLVRLISDQPDRRVQILVVLSAVAVAPLFEEFLYRGLLQGWLEKAAALPDDARRTLMGDQPSEPLDIESTSKSAPPRAWWPIAASALLFALMHWSHGPDWVALFVLGCGLGYLYRQTHRIVPGLVVHLLLNAWSMITLAMIEPG